MPKRQEHLIATKPVKAKPSGTPGGSTLGERLRAQQRRGTDDIEIGSDQDSPDPGEERVEIPAGSMADVMKRVAGIRYLVKDWVPFGMTTMLVAEPGAGKSAFALYALAGPIVHGTNWFNHTSGPKEPGCVLWCDTEGSAAITVQRIKDWGFPPEPIKVLFADDPLMSVNLNDQSHLDQIEAVINRHRIKLVVIDSLRGAHDGDENNSRVAQVLHRLAEIAERTKAAILIIHHARKLSSDEGITANSSRGSNAILALVRSQIGIDRPDKGSDWSRVQILKENLGLKPKPIGFCITSKGLQFGEPPKPPVNNTQREVAMEWLTRNMKPGRWYKAGGLLEGAADEGISEAALRRARNSVGIVKPTNVRKTAAGWEWRLPGPG